MLKYWEYPLSNQSLKATIVNILLLEILLNFSAIVTGIMTHFRFKRLIYMNWTMWLLIHALRNTESLINSPPQWFLTLALVEQYHALKHQSPSLSSMVWVTILVGTKMEVYLLFTYYKNYTNTHTTVQFQPIFCQLQTSHPSFHHVFLLTHHQPWNSDLKENPDFPNRNYNIVCSTCDLSATQLKKIQSCLDIIWLWLISLTWHVFF